MRRLLLGLLLASPSLVWAQGSQVNTQSQKAVGMAGAGSALFVDESSIFYNPGALSKMKGNAVSVSASTVMYRSAFREAGANDVYDTKFKITPPFSVFAAFSPEGARWKAGLGVYTPFGGSVEWGEEWPGKYELNHLQMQAIYVQPTFSYKITENLGIGAGFVYNFGLVDLARSVPVSGTAGQSGKAELSGTGTGMGYNLGVHYNLENVFALSVSYRSKVNTKLKDGDAEFTVPEALASSFPNTKFSAELPLPASLNIGVSFPVNAKVDIAADATFINYSVYKELVFDYKDNTPVLEDTKQLKNYKNAFSGKVGVNYQTSEKLALRAGIGYVKTPVKPEYVSPETPDNDRVMGSIGFTYGISDKWDLSGAYVLQHLMSRQVTSAGTGMTGIYETNIHAPGISLTYKW